MSRSWLSIHITSTRVDTTEVKSLIEHSTFQPPSRFTPFTSIVHISMPSESPIRNKLLALLFGVLQLIPPFMLLYSSPVLAHWQCDNTPLYQCLLVTSGILLLCSTIGFVYVIQPPGQGFSDFGCEIVPLAATLTVAMTMARCMSTLVEDGKGFYLSETLSCQ